MRDDRGLLLSQHLATSPGHGANCECNDLPRSLSYKESFSPNSQGPREGRLHVADRLEPPRPNNQAMNESSVWKLHEGPTSNLPSIQGELTHRKPDRVDTRRLQSGDVILCKPGIPVLSELSINCVGKRFCKCPRISQRGLEFIFPWNWKLDIHFGPDARPT